MDRMHTFLALIISILFQLTFVVSAHSAPLTLHVQGQRASDAKAFLCASTNSKVSRGSVQNGVASISIPSSCTLAYLTGKGKLAGTVLFGVQLDGVMYSVPQAKEQGLCSNSGARGIAFLKNVNQALDLTLEVKEGWAYSTELPTQTFLDTNRTRKIKGLKSSCAPKSAGTLGLKRVATGGARLKAFMPVEIFEDEEDGDNDGAPDQDDIDDDNDGFIDAWDIDNDNDRILDNDDTLDSDRPTNGIATDSFWMFSNFHRNFPESYNKNVMEVTTAMIDDALEGSGGLAIQVIGGGDLDVELNCGGLNYCKSGGTGRSREPYPSGAKFPEELDSDDDGKGDLTPGNTGDFQLAHYATSEYIHPGDILIQEVVEDGKSKRYSGMLNFVFQTTPAVKTVAIANGTTYEVSYPVENGDPGTTGNCFQVPASGDVVVTMEVYRPQRRGVKAAGEENWIDMGNLRLITNLPNGPSPGDPGPGPCPPSVYSNIDENMTLLGDGLQDRLGDRPVDPENFFTYTINLSTCLAARSLGWDPGEQLMVPIQMMNNYGDNTAQNICFVRANS